MNRTIISCMIFLCCLFFSFSFYESLGFKLNELPKVDVLIDTMLSRTLIELRTKYPLSIIGVGGSKQDKKKTIVTVDFALARSLSKDESRELIVDITEVLLRNINQNEDLLPYLYNVPFTCENIDINVFLSHPDHSDIKYPDISLFSLSHGVVRYTIKDPFSRESEPYEKALEIVQAQRREGTITPAPESLPVRGTQLPKPPFFQKVCDTVYDFFK